MKIQATLIKARHCLADDKPSFRVKCRIKDNWFSGWSRWVDVNGYTPYDEPTAREIASAVINGQFIRCSTGDVYTVYAKYSAEL